MKFVKLLFLLIILAVLASVIYLSYLGFIPIISSFMGANKPKDLGVKYTKANYDSYVQKAQTEITLVSAGSDPGKSVKYSGQKTLSEIFSQEDISARLNYANWKYMPVTNTQVRINNDGTVEFSANVIMNQIPGFVAYTGLGKYSLEDLNKGLKYINLLKVNPPIYVKFKAGTTDNKVDLDVQKIEIGKFSLPLDQLDVDSTLKQITENVFTKTAGLTVKSADFSKGLMKFEGTVPERMEIESN